MTGQLGTPREGVMNIAASFPSVMKLRYVNPVGKSQTQKVMLASLVTLQQGSRLRYLLARLQLVATWNLHTTQPRTLLLTYAEVVNLTGLL
jgi:hypothetical protein